MKKVVAIGFMLISAFAADNPMLDLLKSYENKCNAGDEMACGVVGGVYDFAFEAYGVKQDYGKAMKFYKKGCDNGNYRSCNNLGFMYENEKGVKLDYKKTFELYTKSCDIGNDALGCRNLGFLYINKHVSGINEKQAFLEGLGRVKKSCDITPDFTACRFLGDVYLEINEKNDAMKYYQRACTAGATDNVVQSFEEGVKLWQLTCGMYELLKQGSR